MDHGAGRIEAVLFDRDGTLVEDVPYNRRPDLVVPMPTARAAVRCARRAGLRTGVVSNQRGIALGLVTEIQRAVVDARVAALLGPFDVRLHCPHDVGAGCACRKPRPGMVLEAADALGIAPARVAVIGDIGADVEAAGAAGARGVLVPTPATPPDEVRRAPSAAATLLEAVRLLVPESMGRVS